MPVVSTVQNDVAPPARRGEEGMSIGRMSSSEMEISFKGLGRNGLG